jgi:hypothetical protein
MFILYETKEIMRILEWIHRTKEMMRILEWIHETKEIMRILEWIHETKEIMRILKWKRTLRVSVNNVHAKTKKPKRKTKQNKHLPAATAHVMSAARRHCRAIR